MIVGFFKKEVKKHHDRLRFYESITGMSKIIRRYFVMNSFDGALTIFGFLIGSYVAQITDAKLIIGLGLSTSIAIGISGLTGALLTETAEREREIKSMEQALQRNLDDTDYKRAYDFASILAGVVDGVSPVLATLVLLAPFAIIEASQAYYYSFALALLVFFGLGMFLGKISKTSLILTGIKLVAAGLFCMVVLLAIGAV
jgi:predicted membrane protein (TIGR00267 family)